MKIKKTLTKYLCTILLCSTILIPKIPVTNQPSAPTETETVTPYADVSTPTFEN